MNSISSNSSLGNGMQAASQALQSAQKKFETASSDFTHALAASHDQGHARVDTRTTSPQVSQTSQANQAARAAERSGFGSPPNPGPPGGSTPANLTELMLSQDQAGREISANVKTLQAFDQMLEELTRIKPDTRAES